MQRTVAQWANCDPETMANQSRAAIMYAFLDAKADIAELAELVEALRWIMAGDVSRQALANLEKGIGTETDEGRAWLAAKALLDKHDNLRATP